MPSPITVLHVDDEPGFADVAAAHLEREDDRLRVRTETDPTAALDALAGVDCVVSDFEMPGMDGLSFLDAVRDRRPGIPFILFTGKGSEEVASDAISAGVTDYLQKDAGREQYTLLANRVRNAVAQRHSRASYREVFEKTTDSIVLVDPATGAINDANPAATELLGYDRDTLLDMDVGDFCADDAEYTRERAMERVERAMTEGPQQFEWLEVTRSGERRWVDVHLTRTTIDGTDQVLATKRDVTERKAREVALKRERDRRAALFSRTTDCVVYTEFEGDTAVVASVNAAFEETFGYDEADVVGEPLDDRIVPPDERDAARDINRRALDGEQVDTEVTRRTADGLRTFRLRTIPLDTPDSGMTGYAVYTDVTARVERERRLAAQKAKVEALHDVAADVEASETPDAVYEHVLDAAEAILDYDRAIVDAAEDGALVPKAVPESVPADEYYEATPIDADASLAARAYRDGESSLVTHLGDLDVAPADPEYESALTVPIGDYGLFQAVAEEPAAFDEDDRELAELLVTHAREALARLEREATLREQAHELERQNERLAEFAQVVSHDLRNPLNVAQGHLDLARADSDATDHLDTAAAALERMDGLVERTLSLARQGETVGETETVDLAAVARRAWGMVSATNATVDVRDAPRLAADPERLQQLLENLFRNSVEHAGPAVAVTVGALPDGDGFFVADDGPGIPADDRADVFDPGYSTDGDGTGFGLAIVEEIADAHHWTVSVTESEAGGARFEIAGVDA